jgi:tRNA (guanine37-N1)-methyltransferase
MRVDIMTLFPDTMRSVLGESILGRAAKKNIIEINCVQIRDFTDNKQNQVDDYPYGGGWGCVMMAQPLKACLDHILSETPGRRTRVIYMSPQGKTFTQETAKRLKRDYDHLVLVCGHYEGIDERFIEACVDEEISLGDFVLTGGEIAAMAVTDAVCRLVPGVLADEACFTGESHWDGLLEYPQYTRPDIWEDRQVPEILRSGKHEEVDRWRRKKSIERTMDKRPDLFEKLEFTDGLDKKLLEEILEERRPKPVVYRFTERRATLEDLDSILALAEQAKAFLKSRGVDQWQTGYPRQEDFETDIARGDGWVFYHGDTLAGYITFTQLPDPAYAKLENGVWVTGELPYCAIHRVMAADAYRHTGVAMEMVAFAKDMALGLGAASLRVDTHKDNRSMQGMLQKCGFERRGTIHLIGGPEDGEERIALECVLL